MSRLFLSAAVVAVLFAPLAVARAQRNDQVEAYEAARRGAIRPLGDILSRVSPRVGGTFLGSDFDPGARTYRLKYMRAGNVVVVDVDARSGAIIGVTGK